MRVPDESETEPAAAAPTAPGAAPTENATRKEFIQHFFQRAGEFTEELLRENERLRFRVLELEAALAGPSATVTPSTDGTSKLTEMRARLDELVEEQERLLARYRSVEAENRAYVLRHREIERENNQLANLYIASFQLHSSFDLDDITRTITEILVNFIGVKRSAVLLLDEPSGVLRPLAAIGVDKGAVPPLRLGEGALGAAAAAGKTIVNLVGRAPVELSDAPMIVVPLKLRERVVGAIAIWDLLAHRGGGLEEVDHALLDLLAAHAAPALRAAELATEGKGEGANLWGTLKLS